MKLDDCLKGKDAATAALSLEVLEGLLDVSEPRRIQGVVSSGLGSGFSTSALANKFAPRIDREDRTHMASNTKWTTRFTDALWLLTGSKAYPPIDITLAWLSGRDVDSLQQWVGLQPGAPAWSQSIIILDAAVALAEDPAEGMGHEEREIPVAPPAPSPPNPDMPMTTGADAW